MTVIDHQVTPIEAAKELLLFEGLLERPHIILDAAFGSQKLGKFLSDHGYLYTMGVNRHIQDKWLWEEMKSGLCRGEGRVMLNNSGMIASLYYDNEDHSVFTNSWQKKTNIVTLHQGTDSHNASSSSEESSEEEDNNGSDNISELEESVRNIIKRKQSGNRILYKVAWSRGDTTWEPFSAFVDSDKICQEFIQYATEVDWRTGFALYKTDELKEIAKSLPVSRCMYVALSLLNYQAAQKRNYLTA